MTSRDTTLTGDDVRGTDPKSRRPHARRYAKGVTAADALRYVGAPPALLLPYPASTDEHRFLAETCGNMREGWLVPE